MPLIQDIRKTQIGMLREFSHICDTEGLNWWATGDTLMGAVTTHGFLPNAITITVGMLRGDYDRLLMVATKAPFSIQSEETSRGLCFHGARLRMYSSTHLQLNEQYYPVDYNKGMYITILPYDYYGQPSKEAMEGYKEALKMKKELIGMNMRGALTADGLKMRVEGIHDRLMGYIGMCRDMKESNMVTDYGMFSPNRAVEISWVEETLHVKFEDFRIMVPKSHKMFLETMYGKKWMGSLNNIDHLKHVFLVDPHTPYGVTLQNLNGTLTYYA